MERALRQRNRVLEDGARADGLWLDAIEREVAELAVAVASARAETVGRLAATIEALPRGGAFPRADIALAGDVEALCVDHPAIDVEDRYRAMLRANRLQDAAAGRTLVGPQVADLLVRHGPKDIEASLCSTGEQKALLVGLVLAHARLVGDVGGIAPIVLLDEIAAHFDAARREALFAELADLSGQVWMTGADVEAFSSIRSGVQHVRVNAEGAPRTTESYLIVIVTDTRVGRPFGGGDTAPSERTAKVPGPDPLTPLIPPPLETMKETTPEPV
jgi:Recombinational DNA repair ATPase (RecF pathway)